MKNERMMHHMVKQCLFWTLLTIMLHGCANPLPPSGGPRDSEPPSIIRTIPMDKALNVDKNIILIEFNEYVDRAKVLQSIMLSPAIQYEASWSGKELELTMLEPFQSQTTYALSIGTDYADYSGNRPAQSHTIIFSTGSSLDSGTISGTVYGQSVGTFVYLMPVTDSMSFNPSINTSKFKTQIGSNGQFAFNALKPGLYRAYAIQDMFKDGLYDIGTDGYAITSQDISLKSKQQQALMKLSPPIDTASPSIFSAIHSGKGSIELRCSEHIVPSSIHKSFFIPIDAKGKQLQVFSAFIHPTKASVIVVECDTTTTPEFISYGTSKQPMDSAENLLRDSISKRTLSNIKSTQLQPSIHNCSISDSMTIDLMPKLTITCTHSIDIAKLASKISLMQGVQSISFDLQQLVDNQYSIIPKKALTPDSWHTLSIAFQGITSMRGEPYKDTVISLHCKTHDDRLFGSLKGKLIDRSGNGPYIIELTNEKGQVFTHRSEKAGPFTITSLPAGTYKLAAFEDIDNNARQDLGSFVPLRFSERFIHIKESIVIRPRWTIDDIIFQFQEP